MPVEIERRLGFMSWAHYTSLTFHYYLTHRNVRFGYTCLYKARAKTGISVLECWRHENTALEHWIDYFSNINIVRTHRYAMYIYFFFVFGWLMPEQCNTYWRNGTFGSRGSKPEATGKKFVVRQHSLLSSSVLVWGNLECVADCPVEVWHLFTRLMTPYDSPISFLSGKWGWWGGLSTQIYDCQVSTHQDGRTTA